MYRFVVLILGALIMVSAYSDEEIEWYIRQIPEEGRSDFLRYAIVKGYELAEGKPSHLEVPHVDLDVRPQLLIDLYKYFLTHHRVTDITNYPHPLDVICFPTGCIEVDDPGVHP